MDRNHCIDVIAREIITSPGSEDPGDKREDYPDIGEDDWVAVVKRSYQILDNLAPDPRASRTAYQVLAERGRTLITATNHPLDATIIDVENKGDYRHCTVNPPKTSRDRLCVLFGRAGYATVSQDIDCTRHDLLVVAMCLKPRKR